MLDWTRAAWSRARKYSHEGRLYLNLAGHEGEGGDLVRDAFGRNYRRLAEIKSRHDPGNMFRFNQNIEPAG